MSRARSPRPSPRPGRRRCSSTSPKRSMAISAWRPRAISRSCCGKALPLTRQDSSMHDTVVEMSVKRLGVVGVTDSAGYLIGVITDGDLRRNIERGLDHSAGEFMTRDPKTISPDDLIDDALSLFDEYKITALFVVKDDGRGKKPVGVLHIHDCPAAR